METKGEEIVNLAKSGTLSVDELQTMFGTAANGVVSVSDWDVCYSSATGQLSEFATVVANSPSNPITGFGLLLYSADGTKLYGAQYTNIHSGATLTWIETSLGTTLYNTADGNQALCIVYGWTLAGSFYFPATKTIGSCN